MKSASVRASVEQSRCCLTGEERAELRRGFKLWNWIEFFERRREGVRQTPQRTMDLFCVPSNHAIPDRADEEDRSNAAGPPRTAAELFQGEKGIFQWHRRRLQPPADLMRCLRVGPKALRQPALAGQSAHAPIYSAFLAFYKKPCHHRQWSRTRKSRAGC